jgi:hypothetical protein
MFERMKKRVEQEAEQKRHSSQEQEDHDRGNYSSNRNDGVACEHQKKMPRNENLLFGAMQRAREMKDF